MAQRPPQDGHVDVLQTTVGLRLARLGLLGLLEEPVREHRHDRQRDDQRRDQGGGDREPERPEELAHDAAHQRDREEHRDRRERRGGHRTGDLAHALHDRRLFVFPGSQVALDVFQHDDGVVNNAPDRDRQSAQCQHVERITEAPQRDQRDDDADRDRHRGDERGAHRQQEHQDHQHGKGKAEQAFRGQAPDGLLHLRRLIEDHVEPRARVTLQSGQFVADRVGDLHRVRPGHGRHGDAQAGLAVGARDGGELTFAGVHSGHIAQLRGGIQIQLADLVQRREAAADRDRV